MPARSSAAPRRVGPCSRTRATASSPASTPCSPYDWRAFFAARIDALAPYPPDPFTATGWKLAYAQTPSPWQKIVERVGKGFAARYSLGIVGGDRGGVVNDVIDGSPAQKAGLSPGDIIEAVDDRAASQTRTLQDGLDAALVAAKRGGPPVRLLVLGGGTYRELTIPYNGGPRYPVLERIPGAPDGLDALSKPLAS